MANRVYHWKHGWIPLDHVAAMSKAKGNKDAARRYLEPVSKDNLPRESHITAAHAQNGHFVLSDAKTGHVATVPESHAEALHSDGHTITSVTSGGALTTRAPAGNTESARLAAAAEAKRAEAERVAGSAGVADTAAGRLSAPGLKQAHRRTDSSLRRYTELRAEADALDHKAGLARQREAEAARTHLTHEDIKGATHVKDRFGWHEVVRVNGKTVTVKTPYSWTDAIPHGKILQVHRRK